MTISGKLVRWIVIAVVVGVVALGFIFSRRTTPRDPSSSTSNAPAALSSTPTVSNISDSTTAPTTSAFPTNVSAPILIGDSLSYYDSDSLTLQQFDLGKNTSKTLLSLVLGQSALVSWAAQGTRLVGELVATTPAWSSIDTQTGTVTTLDAGVFLPTLNPTGTRLAYQYLDRQRGTITVTVADAVGKNWASILAVSKRYAHLWFGPVDTYLVALDDTDTTPHYDRIGISSKSATKLADGNGDLKWSPSGQLALLDSVDGQSITVAQLESGALTKINGATTVDRLAWESESALVGFVGSDLVRLDLTNRTKTVLTKNAAADNERASVLGISQEQLVLFNAGGVSLLAVPKS